MGQQEGHGRQEKHGPPKAGLGPLAHITHLYLYDVYLAKANQSYRCLWLVMWSKLWRKQFRMD